MRTLNSFMSISLDGCFAAAGGDMSWAHSNDPEYQEFVNQNAQGGGALLFGRVTYQMMASFWPTPMAAQQMPQVAEGMNRMPKYVISRTLEKADWRNTTLLQGDLGDEIRKLKREDGPPIAILGSGSLVAQLADAGLIDEFQIVVKPIVLGSGQRLFDGLHNRLGLKLHKSRTFGNGSVFLSYVPAK